MPDSLSCSVENLYNQPHGFYSVVRSITSIFLHKILSSTVKSPTHLLKATFTKNQREKTNDFLDFFIFGYKF